MPYIHKDDRKKFNKILSEIPEIENAGELNYIITMVCLEYLKKGKRYSNMNDIIGALECAKLEFYRRIVSPYETEKISTNGDIIEEE